MESSSTPRKEKKGLGKLWTKVKLALRSKSKSKTSSDPPATDSADTTSTQPPTAQSHSPAGPNLHQDATERISTSQPVDTQLSAQPPTDMEQPAVPTTYNAQVTDERLPTDDTAQQPPVKPGHEPMPEASSPRDEKGEQNRRYERAQAIFKKYNLDINEVEWEPRPATQGERVYKSPRMRVRWTCHECKTTFGHDKICVECAHQRCRECPRYPARKKKPRAAKRAAVAAVAATTSDAAETPEVQAGTCHECQTTFELGSAECSSCHHQICERCLQETVASAEQTQGQAVRAA